MTFMNSTEDFLNDASVEVLKAFDESQVQESLKELAAKKLQEFENIITFAQRYDDAEDVQVIVQGGIEEFLRAKKYVQDCYTAASTPNEFYNCEDLENYYKELYPGFD